MTALTASTSDKRRGHSRPLQIAKAFFEVPYLLALIPALKLQTCYLRLKARYLGFKIRRLAQRCIALGGDQGRAFAGNVGDARLAETAKQAAEPIGDKHGSQEGAR